MKKWIKKGNTVIAEMVQPDHTYKMVPGVIEKIEDSPQDGKLIYLRGHTPPVTPIDIYPCLQWVPIDPGNLPRGEVLAGNFDESYPYTGLKLIGVLAHSKDAIVCRHDVQQIEATHYIKIHDYDIEL